MSRTRDAVDKLIAHMIDVYGEELVVALLTPSAAPSDSTTGADPAADPAVFSLPERRSTPDLEPEGGEDARA